ncbi:MAG: DUF6519 domain-containing protein, partial [Gammaproteobacteria bacterium]|nr:DUF6519 domain-containing protein [Gammaproteobacteria bacterium]
MKGDFSRFTFRRDHHYSGVRMQQGRVQLDADWNEQVDIQAYLRNTEARDVIGVSGVPHERGGFLIAVAGNNFKIADGRIYVDGVLVENESEVYYRSETGRVHQPHYPVTSADEPLAAGLFLVYLDVWQRHITALEAPQVREVALGGPDTTTRMQTLWQARLLRVGGPGAALTCWDIPAAWDALLKRQHGALRARAQVPETVTDPCVVPAGAGYRRLENQLYRVEIHNSTQSGAATFKWSRDNGMVVTRVVDVQGRIISVADAGRDAVLGFANGQWVEISDDTRVLRGEPGVLVRVLNVVENTLEIEAWPGATPDIAPFFDPQTRTVRRWDHVSDVDEVTHVATGTVAVSTVGWIELEDGVQVNFDGSHPYDTGDYWLIPARTVNTATLGGTVEWPLAADGITPAWLPPQGIQHRYARLALLEWNGAAYIFKHDCRSMFPALTEPDLYYISGDGQEAMPGDTLPQVLAAGVSNCNRPIEGAWVKFALDKEGSGGDGQLSPRVGTAPARIHPSSNDKQLIIMTDALGEAACVWRLQTRATLEPDIINESPTLPVQQVRATLLQNPTDADALKLDRPLVYSASFGVASENQFGGSVFPDGQYDALIVQTVEDALDQLRENVALYYVGGDAQWVAPGPRNGTEEEGVTRVRLQHPLEVRVANGDWPYVGAEVEFSIEAGDGVLALESESSGGSDTLTVSTDSDGIARCYWDLDRSTPVQQVTARLNAAGTLTITSQSRIDFLARLNTADQITYDGSEFPDDQHPSLKVDTVEQALDQLRENTTLLYVGGDGQTVYPGEQLALPLQVRIANGQWPREGATVQFSVEHGTLSEGESSGSQITAFSNADGLVQCYWTPDADGPITQQAIAVLTSPSQFADSEDASTPGYVYFNAHLNKAEDSYYSPNSESLQESPPETVQGAIDELYGMKVNRAGDVMYGDLGINGELAVQKDVHIGYHSEWNSDSHLNLSPASQYAVVAINGGLHVGGDKDPGDKNAVIDGNLTVHGNLRVQGETVVVNTDKMQGNVVLGDEDADIITVEGRIITGHSSGALQVQSPLAVSGAAAFASNVAVGGVLQGNNIVNTAQIADASVTKAKLASDVSLGGADLSRIHRVPLLQQTLFQRAFKT